MYSYEFKILRSRDNDDARLTESGNTRVDRNVQEPGSLTEVTDLFVGTLPLLLSGCGHCNPWLRHLWHLTHA